MRRCSRASARRAPRREPMPGRAPGHAPAPPHPRHRRHAHHGALGEGGRRRHLQGRLRLPPAALLRSLHGRGARRHAAPRQRRRQHRRRPHRRARGGARAAARGRRDKGTLVRCDSAGRRTPSSRRWSRGTLLLRGLELSDRLRAAILALPESAWTPALDTEGGERAGAWVAELSSTSQPGPPAAGRSAAASDRTPERSSPSAILTATASR